MADILEELTRINNEQKEWFDKNYKCIGIITENGKILYYSDTDIIETKQNSSKPTWTDNLK